MAQTHTHTYIHTYGHGDSMTNSAQWGRVGEKAVLKKIALFGLGRFGKHLQLLSIVLDGTARYGIMLLGPRGKN